ncbi:hypothetical protein CCUS01_13792 [Colletotrichum cuscutae]|uniref:Uncharacterized protein n=1 Tax=Colletotrichum cuscutae TaxID=1209917 RepID=A0AAI9YB43_9PEZI|nr:hypothetical protein CCUS01_13792 [Colletotrichum cuscutae]
MWKSSGCGRVFPLVHTGDFHANWVAVDDPGGIFGTVSGARCRVEPQLHHVARCEVKADYDRGSGVDIIPYEAIIFAKVSYSLLVLLSQG